MVVVVVTEGSAPMVAATLVEGTGVVVVVLVARLLVTLDVVSSDVEVACVTIGLLSGAAVPDRKGLLVVVVVAVDLPTFGRVVREDESSS